MRRLVTVALALWLWVGGAEHASAAPRTLAFTVANFGHKDLIAMKPFTAKRGFSAVYSTVCRVGPNTTIHPGGDLMIYVVPGGEKNMNYPHIVDIAMIRVGASNRGSRRFKEHGYFKLLVNIQPQCSWAIRVTS